MTDAAVNQEIVKRFDELIAEGKCLWEDFQDSPGTIMDPIRFARWATSCLNLLDRLSVSTNRFVTEFESWAKRAPGREINLGAALGVLTAASDEYHRGFAIDYHLAVASSVFGDLLEQSEYLLTKGYLRAAAVLAGASLEEALKTRAKAISIPLNGKETLIPLCHLLKAPDIGVLTELQSKIVEAIAKVRNDAAHGDPFNYGSTDLERTVSDCRSLMRRVLGER
jgi:hypothetical protein